MRLRFRLIAIAALCAAAASCRAPPVVTLDATPPADPAKGADRAPREVVAERLPEHPAPPPDVVPPPVEDLPAYRQLAYRPPEATSLLELPATFYTVQLLALSSKRAVEAYVRDRGLSHMSAARIANGRRVYYVLLLGVYPDRDAANRAAADLPPGTEDATVWVRSLGSIQEGIEQANRLFGSTQY